MNVIRLDPYSVTKDSDLAVEIVLDEGEQLWQVWIGLHEGARHLSEETHSFILSEGPTRPVAMDLARKALALAVHLLDNESYK